ncbi:MAG: hypothetical protein ACHQEA_14835, partial [Gaiellales bacterium]
VLIAPASPMAAPTAPSLGIAGASFTIDGRPRFLLLVSYFDALRASDATLEADFGGRINVILVPETLGF